MKKESDLWKLLKKNTPEIKWTRLESWASYGVPDALGYHDSCGFFLVELKLITKENQKKVRFSPHQILFASTMTKRNFILVGLTQAPGRGSVKLYQSSSVLGLLADIREVPPLAADDWGHINACLLANRS